MSLMIWPSGPSTPPQAPRWMDEYDPDERDADAARYTAEEALDQHYSDDGPEDTPDWWEVGEWCPRCQHEHYEGIGHACPCPDCGARGGRHRAGCVSR